MKTELKKSVTQEGKVEVYEGQVYTLKIINGTEEFVGREIKRKRPLFEKKQGDFIPNLNILENSWLNADKKPPTVIVGTTSYFQIGKEEVLEVAENLIKGVEDAEAFEEILKVMFEYNEEEYDKAMEGYTNE